MFYFLKLQEIGFHTMSLMNSTYPSTISDKSSSSYARMFAQHSMSEAQVTIQMLHRKQTHCLYNAILADNSSLCFTRILDSLNIK